ncbi:MAG TPA: diacylglycerol kinase family protein [Solirubrobacteraceae bacterium]|jgi:YegS/Rv2252/BmrU family lipid kinase
MKLRVIANPAAGGGRTARHLEGVRRALRDLRLEHELDLTRSLDHARELARTATSRGEIAVAFGGDGLIGAVADALKRTDGTLGVLPGGRGNDFARVLGIPSEPRAACQVLATGKIRPIDLGTAGDATFIGIASCGFDSDANRVANESKLIRGNLVYAYGALRTLASWRPARFEVTVDGESRSVSAYTIAAANSKAYGGGMMLAPDAELDDGLLDVVIVEDIPKLRFLRLLPSVFKGEHVHQPTVHVLRGARIEIRADRPFTVYADGDPVAELPVTLGTVPRAVRVLVP